jgi:UTP-glucose-1-phosphate uridylyltransferase
MAATLVVLAAGMGSRYGGLKQIDPVGPSGETVLDYAVFDALRAGFNRVVFVIRKDIEDAFRTSVGSKYAGKVNVDYVFQDQNDLPSGCLISNERIKPWGTGHAVWCARHTVREPFAVINADDFYGRDAFRKLGDFLNSPKIGSENACFAIIGFKLKDTLSEFGSVARGICTTDKSTLLSIEETTGIQAIDVGEGKKLTGNEVVSMNCWAFSPDLFKLLERELKLFIINNGSNPKAEFYLPVTVSDMVKANSVSVEVYIAESKWFGVTFKEDKPHVQLAIQQLIDQAEYPTCLYI